MLERRLIEQPVRETMEISGKPFQRIIAWLKQPDDLIQRKQAFAQLPAQFAGLNRPWNAIEEITLGDQA